MYTEVISIIAGLLTLIGVFAFLKAVITKKVGYVLTSAGMFSRLVMFLMIIFMTFAVKLIETLAP